ncbi:hypothetical protein GOP47_0016253 [Adiantum capillus-veneris]|uniref:Glycosyl transferase family 3 N-terminal domain-containing protein n=1 Tax=Adiantum capillus-veneris TaxID=13818 RepID=A0A9D4UI89_ADICA|nr:hypothetical protein GOP47_0016253 [Adiantum capillus-veneris]
MASIHHLCPLSISAFASHGEFFEASLRRASFSTPLELSRKGNLHHSSIYATSVSAPALAPTSLSTMPQLLEALISRRDLTEAETEVAMENLLSGGDVAQISAFLVLLRANQWSGSSHD